jgi:O-antigen ligase
VLFFYIGLFTIFLSSRIVTLSFLLITLYGALRVSEGTFPPTLKWAYSLIPVSLLCLLIYLNPVSRFRNYQEIASTPGTFNKPGMQTQSMGIRASLWLVGIRSLDEVNPLWGTGPGDVEGVMKTTSDRARIHNSLDSYDPHNQYLQTLLGLGIIGLATLLLCFALPAHTAWRQGDYFYLGFISLVALVCVTESVLEVQKGIVFFALFNSLLIFQYSNFQTHKSVLHD